MVDLPNVALSIRQPWAWAIVNAGKDVENRQWHTNYRGPVCIHAAKGMTWAEWEEANFFIEAKMKVPTPQRQELARGGIIGTARVVDCVRESDSPWFFGRWGFVLADAKPVPFIPAKGALGFFRWSPSRPGSDA